MYTNSQKVASRPQPLKSKYKKQVEFLQFHFPQKDGDFFAFIPMYCRDMQYTYNEETMRKRRRGLYQSAGLNTSDIALLNLNSKTASNKEMNILTRLNGIGNTSKDYYIAANGMSNPTMRRNSTLFRLYNIVIDIDCHHTDTNSTNFSIALNSLLSAMENEEGLVQPNTIVKTGRGVQLWYALAPSSYKLKKAYSCVREDLIRRFKMMIGDSNLLRPYFNIDPVASKNFVGIFRMPGSRNTVAGKTSTFETVHTNRLDLMLYMDEHAETELISLEKRKKTKHPGARKKTPKKVSAFAKEVFFKERTALIENLIRLRGQNDIGYRDTYALIYLSAYLTSGKPFDEAWSAVMALNRMLPHPLREDELAGYMTSCCRKRGYRFTTRTVLDRLGVTEKEREILGVDVCTNKREAHKREIHKRKARRNRIILDLAEHYYNQRQIARMAGCSQATVCRVLANRDTVEVEPREVKEDVTSIGEKEENTKEREVFIKENPATSIEKNNFNGERNQDQKNTHILSSVVVVSESSDTPSDKMLWKTWLQLTPEEREEHQKEWKLKHPYYPKH